MQSEGVPETAKVLSSISVTVRGSLSVSELLAPLWLYSGATTVTRPKRSITDVSALMP